MSIYQIAAHVQPSTFENYSGKVIWKGARSEFAYLFRIDEVIYLRMSFSIAQLIFFTLYRDNWLTVNENLYKEIVELWITEKAEVGKMQSSGQLSLI